MGRRLLLLIFAAGIVGGCAGAPPVQWDGQGRSAVQLPVTPPTTAPAPAAPVTASCTGPGSPVGYARPYAATAPWNVPVCGLQADPRSDDWRDRFWYYSRFNAYMTSDPSKSTEVGKQDVMFGLDADPTRDFSVAVYDVRDATTSIRVFPRQGWNGKFNIAKASSIPWNPSWRASSGSDAMMVVLDPRDGSQWSLWGVAQSYYGLPTNDTQCWGDILSVWLPGGGFRPGVDLCVGGADRVTKAGSTDLADYRTYGGNNPMTRGVGIDRYAMLVTPQEVATGAIHHALGMPVYNTMNGGSVCTEAQASTTALGSTCGQSVAPAGNFEHASSPTKGCGEPITQTMSAEQYRRTTLPAGTRFALSMTPAEIERWLDSRGYTGQLRITARAFATALVDYGWFITDTTCTASNFQVAGAANPQTAASWRALGIAGDGRDLLRGLITRDRIWTVERPVNHCVGGYDSQLACPARSASYR
jgi:hypothetical protein